MTPDARIDPELAGDDFLPLLISDRLSWTYAPLTLEELERLERSLAPGPRAVIALNDAWTEVFNGGVVQLLYNHGHRLGEAVDAAAVVDAPGYEELFGELADLAGELPAAHHERLERVEELLDDVDVDARLEGLEERYYELEEHVGSPVDCGLRYVDAHPDEFFLSVAEAVADRNAFIARLAARVGPVERATPAELDPDLPPLLQRLYLEVGATGWGPELGFIRPTPQEDTYLAIARAEDGRLICADTSEPRLPLARLPTTGPIIPTVATSLRGWLETWLAG